MNNMIRLFSGLLFLSIVSASELPEEIIQGFRDGGLLESGGISLGQTNREYFFDFISKNWEGLAGGIENLPQAESRNKNGGFSKKGAALRNSIELFGASCEHLEPKEYVRFLNKWIDLYEDKKIDFSILKSQMRGCGPKMDFLEVNFEDPQVKEILSRAKSIMPEGEDDFRKWLDMVSSGELADNYLGTRDDDAAPPETLPGIKLRTSVKSYLAKLRRWNGVPASASASLRGTGERPHNAPGAVVGKMESSNVRWTIGGAIAVLGAAIVLLIRSRKRSQP